MFCLFNSYLEWWDNDQDMRITFRNVCINMKILIINGRLINLTENYCKNNSVTQLPTTLLSSRE